MKIPKTARGEIFRRVRIEKQSMKQVALDFQVSVARISQIVKEMEKEVNENPSN